MTSNGRSPTHRLRTPSAMVAGAAGRGMRRPARSDAWASAAAAGSTPTTRVAGRAALDGGGRPGDQPAPAHRDQHQVQVGGVLEQLEGGRALPGHHVVVVEGVDQAQAAGGGQLGREGLAVLAGHPGHDHLGPVGPGGGHLGRVGAGRHHHHRPAPGLGRGQGDRLAVVAGADRQDPGRPAAGSRASRALNAPLALNAPTRCRCSALATTWQPSSRSSRREVSDRGAVDAAGDPGGRPLHVGDREEVGSLIRRRRRPPWRPARRRRR